MLRAGVQYITQTTWVGAMFRCAGQQAGVCGGLRDKRNRSQKKCGKRCWAASQFCLSDFGHCPEISIHLDTNPPPRLEETEALSWKLHLLPAPDQQTCASAPRPSLRLRGEDMPAPAQGMFLHLCSGPLPSASLSTVPFIVSLTLQICNVSFLIITAFYLQHLNMFKSLPP